MTGAQVTTTLDCRGLICPLPIIKLSKAIKAIAVGTAVELLATDPGAVADLEAFEKQTGHRVLDRSQSDGVFRFVVERRR
jgi:tRNA 2-thiouridine synthesizing protein A